MPRMELTLKTDYLPGWDASCGIREFVQNARDAEIQEGAEMTISWYKDTLRIENVGCTLPREVLLFGHTTKFGVSEMIGKFGEGLKLGALVLTRNGFPVTIRTGSEVWKPVLERSEKFNAIVLVFNISENRKHENRVRVEIGNVSRDMWEKLQQRFLFLDEKEGAFDAGSERANSRIKTHHGSLLLEPKYAGHIFVKGIFVQKTENTYGYDLTDVELDRDRKMVDSYSLESTLRSIWSEAAASRPDLLESFVNLIESQSSDVTNVSRYTASYLPKEVLIHVAARFKNLYGTNAVPVANIEESRDIEHLGKRGIVVNRQMGALLEQTFGDITKTKEALRKETKTMHSWSDLNEDERGALEWTSELIHSVSETCNLSDIDIVDFASEELEGLFKDGRVQVARKHLSDVDKTLQILVHEFAHKLGGDDGDKGHVSNIENLWMKVFSKCRCTP